MFRPSRRSSSGPYQRVTNYTYRCGLLGVKRLNVIRNSEVLQRGFGQDAWKCEGWNCYQNSTGANLPKSTLEREDHVPRGEHIDPIKSCLIRDDLHDSTPLLSRTPPYSCFEGDPMDKSTASPPVARWEWARKHPLHRREIFHHRGAG